LLARVALGVAAVGLAALLLLRRNETRLVSVPGSRTITPPPPALGLRPETVQFPSEDGAGGHAAGFERDSAAPFGAIRRFVGALPAR
jgi:hypothetical protein